MESSTSYTLYLTSSSIPENLYVSPVNNTNIANVSWNVNWDALFNNQQHLYKFCKVRYHFVTKAKLDTSLWDTYLGYLSCNLASNFNASSSSGTVLGLLNYNFRVGYNTISGAETEYSIFDVNTFNTAGINVNIPSGVSVLNIQMMNDDSYSFFNLHQEHYQILFQFELYNE